MKKSNFIMFVAAIAAMASCAKEEASTTSSSENGSTIVATIDDDATKTTLVDGVKVCWINGDAIAVNKTKYVATPDETDGRKATFTLTSTTATPPTEAPFCAYYPFDANKTTSAGQFILPSTQSYSTSNPLGLVNPMYAVSESLEGTFHFKNVCGLLAIDVTGLGTVSNITVSANEYLAGTLTDIAISETGELTYGDFLEEGASKSVSLGCGKVATLDPTTPRRFYIALPERDLTGLEIAITTTSGTTETFLAKKTVSIEKNNIYHMAFEVLPPFDAEIDVMSVSEYLGMPYDAYPDWSSFITYVGMPTVPAVAGSCGIWKASAWADIIEDWDANKEDAIAIVDEYGDTLTSGDLAQVNELKNEEDMAYWVWSDMDPETEYIFVVKLVDAAGRVWIDYATHTTSEAPEEPDYTGELVLGDYFMSDSSNGSENTFTVKSADGGDTNYIIKKLAYYGDTFSWNGVYDKTANTLTVDGTAVGYEDIGPLWYYTLFTVSGYSAGYVSGDSGEEPLVFTVDPDSKQVNGLAEGSSIYLFAASGSSILGFFLGFEAATTTITYDSSSASAPAVQNIKSFRQPANGHIMASGISKPDFKSVSGKIDNQTMISIAE